MGAGRPRSSVRSCSGLSGITDVNGPTATRARRSSGGRAVRPWCGFDRERFRLIPGLLARCLRYWRIFTEFTSGDKGAQGRQLRNAAWRQLGSILLQILPPAARWQFTGLPQLKTLDPQTMAFRDDAARGSARRFRRFRALALTIIAGRSCSLMNTTRLPSYYSTWYSTGSSTTSGMMSWKIPVSVRVDNRMAAG